MINVIIIKKKRIISIKKWIKEKQNTIINLTNTSEGKKVRKKLLLKQSLIIFVYGIIFMIILELQSIELIGIETFIKEKLPILKSKNIDFLLNIAGSTIEDYEKLAEIAQKYNIKALEVNVSCPNVKSGCLEFGLNPDSLFKLISKIRENYNNFLIVKLSPNTNNIKLLAKATENGGADCISAINTLRGLGIKIQFDGQKFIKKSVKGGLSGPCIKPIALYMIEEIRNSTNLPIIAMGGITKLSDLFEFILAGADAFQIGTANFIKPSICTDLAIELSDFIEKNNFKNFEELKNKIKETK